MSVFGFLEDKAIAAAGFDPAELRALASKASHALKAFTDREKQLLMKLLDHFAGGS